MSKIYLYINEKSHHEIDNFCGKKKQKKVLNLVTISLNTCKNLLNLLLTEAITHTTTTLKPIHYTHFIFKQSMNFLPLSTK